MGWCLHREQRFRPINTQFGRFKTYFYVTYYWKVFKCTSTEKKDKHKKDCPINLPTHAHIYIFVGTFIDIEDTQLFTLFRSIQTNPNPNIN